MSEMKITTKLHFTPSEDDAIIFYSAYGSTKLKDNIQEKKDTWKTLPALTQRYTNTATTSGQQPTAAQYNDVTSRRRKTVLLQRPKTQDTKTVLLHVVIVHSHSTIQLDTMIQVERNSLHSERNSTQYNAKSIQ